MRIEHNLIITEFQKMQQHVLQALVGLDPKLQVTKDQWDRGSNEGGGLTIVAQNGTFFEKAGVNFSEVFGEMPTELAKVVLAGAQPSHFYATGTSIVIHPSSPMMPTVHANVRYLEVDNLAWFGGGADLTPYYLFDEDARHFHHTWQKTCNQFDESYYPRFKKQCDEYFFLPHRGEARGIGGIFFDHLGKESPTELPAIWEFVKGVANTFVEAYFPIAEKRKAAQWSEEQKQFQLLRRGRYVEFNLLYDRGTLFGLKSRGRTESILMSLPPEVRWEYDQPKSFGPREQALYEVLRQPKEWV